MKYPNLIHSIFHSFIHRFIYSLYRSFIHNYFFLSFVYQPGHVFTIEPMINLGDHRDCLWPDQWTAVTRDGSRSAQFEHTMLITEGGAGVKLLTARPGDPTDRLVWSRDKFQR